MPGKNEPPRRGTLGKVLGYVGRSRALIVWMLLCALVGVALTLYVPVLVAQAIDGIIGAGKVDFRRVAELLARIGLSVLITAAAQWAMNVIAHKVAYGTVEEIRAAAFHRIERLPLSYLDAHPSGELASRVIADVDQFSDGLLMGFPQLFTGVATIAGTLIFMLLIDARVTLVVVLITPLSLVVAAFIARRTRDMFRAQAEARAEQTAFVEEIISGQKVVRAFAHERAVEARFDEIAGKLEGASLRATFYSSITNPATRFVNALVYAGVGMAGALSAMSGGISVGALSAFLTYANQYTKPFNEISGVMAELTNALSCAERVFELIEAPTEAPDAEGALEMEDVLGRVALDKVWFSYRPDRPLIEDLSLEAKPGERVAIVGPTGGGKTTLINLLMRFYDADRGAISVDGADVLRIKRASLRASFGMVLQDTWLRGGTVRENIALGRPDASDEEIASAARAAHAHSFIMRLSNGYDTQLTGGEAALSQGQRQLIGIARVMLMNPSMLILDEATSSIDTRTERRIQDAFARMMEGKTSFIVAHRLSTIEHADLILVMENGRVVEQGRHWDLLKRGGSYARLYNSQFDMIRGNA
ncbi:MAG: ABC transporter ATP-binding protein [Christensenellaceae bacterium]|nr:ABC transporter ATP-binding protein [Christensenellaceae bacterium]MEA5066950.1 ABC transporter ATP-binding protein [Eubacteriales bacterium]MEA5069261.1 ABC transporter ATP-binding protein [Christensenellaceae bacterium]